MSLQASETGKYRHEQSKIFVEKSIDEVKSYRMKNFLKERKLALLFALLGAAGGFIYWRFIGCTSGTCPIQSVWYWSTLWGAAAGYLIGDFVTDIVIRQKKKKEEIK